MGNTVSENKNLCRCGCGREIELLNYRGQLKKYVKGHNVKNFVKHGPEHPSWRGGRTYDKNGYVMIWVSNVNHPRIRGNGQYVLEHILVMEKHLGRHLTKDERVHHINEDKKDNRIENLQLMTDVEHKSFHTLKMWKEGKYNNRQNNSRKHLQEPWVPPGPSLPGTGTSGES